MVVVVMQVFGLWVMIVSLQHVPVTVGVFLAKEEHHPDEHQDRCHRDGRR